MARRICEWREDEDGKECIWFHLDWNDWTHDYYWVYPDGTYKHVHEDMGYSEGIETGVLPCLHYFVNINADASLHIDWDWEEE